MGDMGKVTDECTVITTKTNKGLYIFNPLETGKEEMDSKFFG